MKPTVDQVIEDLAERKRVGIERYGQALTSEMPHDMLQEAYEEALDLVVYLRCAIEKRDKGMI
jgi:hypothetical protein